MEAFRRKNRLYTSAAEAVGVSLQGIPEAYRTAIERETADARPRASAYERARAMGNLPDIAYRPAITPLEAAMLPAQERRSFGALSHLRQSWRIGRSPAREDALQHLARRRFIGRRSASDRRDLPR